MAAGEEASGWEEEVRARVAPRVAAWEAAWWVAA